MIPANLKLCNKHIVKDQKIILDDLPIDSGLRLHNIPGGQNVKFFKKSEYKLDGKVVTFNRKLKNGTPIYSSYFYD